MPGKDALESKSTFIAVAEDCPASGETPPERAAPTAASIQFEMLTAEPYRYAQPEILFASSTAARAGEAGPDSEAAFFDKPQPCLRTSPLVRRYGWGIHFDADGHAAAFPRGSEQYDRLASDDALTQTRGVRSKRA